MESPPESLPDSVTWDLHRSRHILHETETRENSAEEISPQQKWLGKSVQSAQKPGIISQGVDIRLLLNLIVTIYEEDATSDNQLALEGRVFNGFTGWRRIGTGATFLVRQANYPLTINATGHYSSSRRTRAWFDSEGNEISRAFVVKQLLLPRTRADETKSARAFQRVLQELRTLTHHPLKMHENILDFLGIMWEYVDGQVWPVLMVEYANMGTLSAFLAQPLCLTFKTKCDITLDIGNGITALHGCGIVHGDIKSDNILIFTSVERGYVAKISDFGSCVNTSWADGPVPDTLLHIPGHTPIWTSPEFPSFISRAAFEANDIFGFGLVFSTVMLNGKSLSDCFRPSEDSVRDLDALKHIKSNSFFLRLMEGLVDQYCSMYCPGCDMNISLVKDVFRALLDPDMQNRRLPAALGILRSQVESQRTGIQSPLRPVVQPRGPAVGFKEYNINFEVINRLPRSLQVQLAMQWIRNLPGEGEKFDFENRHNLKEELVISCKLMLENFAPIRFGAKYPNDREHVEKLSMGSICEGSPSFGDPSFSQYQKLHNQVTVHYLVAAAQTEDISAQAFAANIFTALQLYHEDELPMRDYLRGAARYGQVDLVQDLLAADEYKILKKHALRDVAESALDLLPAMEILKQGQSSSRPLASLLTDLRIESLNPDVSVGHHVPIKLRAALLAIIRDEDTDNLRKILQDDPELLESTDPLGRSLLRLSCSVGNLAAARILLEMGADPSSPGDYSPAPLHYISAFSEDEYETIVALLIERGADVNLNFRGRSEDEHFNPSISERYSCSGTPLHHAVLGKDFAAVKVLTRFGADPLREDDNHNTPVALAAGLHCTAILEYLIAFAKINLEEWRDHWGNSLVFEVLRAKFKFRRILLHNWDYYDRIHSTLALLQQKGASFDRLARMNRVTALQLSVLESSSNVTSLLFQMGISESLEKSSYLSTPLLLSIGKEDEQTFMLLLFHGANVHAKELGTANTALHLCVLHQHLQTFFVETLLARGIPVDVVNSAGQTAFSLAVSLQLWHIAKLLLKHGADINHKNHENNTILGEAVQSWDDVLPCVKFLLNPPTGHEPATFIVNESKGRSVLHQAVNIISYCGPGFDVSATLDFLLERFSSPEELNCRESDTSMTALTMACMTKSSEAVSALLSAGADPSIPPFGQPPITDQKWWDIWYYFRFGSKISDTYTEPMAVADFAKQYGPVKRLIDNRDIVRPRLPPRPKAITNDESRRRVIRFLEVTKTAGIKNLPVVYDSGVRDLPSEDNIEELFVSDACLAEAVLLCSPGIRGRACVLKPWGYCWIPTSQPNKKYEAEVADGVGGLGTLSALFAMKEPPPFTLMLILTFDSLIAFKHIHRAGFLLGQINTTSLLIADTDRPETGDLYACVTNFGHAVEKAAPAEAVLHYNVVCDGEKCRDSGKSEDIRGIRWKCEICDNYDLCSQCIAFHDSSHPMTRWEESEYKEAVEGDVVTTPPAGSTTDSDITHQTYLPTGLSQVEHERPGVNDSRPRSNQQYQTSPSLLKASTTTKETELSNESKSPAAIDTRPEATFDGPRSYLYKRQDSVFDPPETRLLRKTLLDFEGMYRCEIFSLGVVILHIFCHGQLKGQGTFETNPNYLKSSTEQILVNLTSEAYRPAAEIVMQALLRMLADRPQERPTSIDWVFDQICLAFSLMPDEVFTYTENPDADYMARFREFCNNFDSSDDDDDDDV